MNEKPYAQVLIDWFDEDEGFKQGTKAPHKWVLQAAAELRRLHAEVERLQAQAQPAAREPLTWLEILRKNPEATDEVVGAYLRGHAEFLTGEKFILEACPQQALAQPAARAARTDQQIVDETEELAAWLLSWGFNRQPETNTPLRESPHPLAKRCWSAACHIQEMLTATDPENSLSELDEASSQPHPNNKETHYD